MAAAYQFVLVSAGGGAFETGVTAAIRDEIERRTQDLGLVASEIAVLGGSVGGGVDPGTPVVAAYVSDTSDPGDSPTVDALVGAALLVLPVVSDLKRFKRLVPPALQGLHGLEPAVGDSTYVGVAVQVVGRMLEELRLLRRRRRLFISYRRTESTGVAEQLHEALERRRYQVFLDTFNVDYGLDFQSVLWDSLGDCDAVVLLATKTAFDNEWVEKEISRANVSGVAVVQFVWPDVAERQKGTEFAETIYLSAASFSGGDHSKAGWTDATLADALTRIEAVRARAHVARRARVLDELRAATARVGVALHLEKDGVARLDRAATATRVALTERLLPIVGHPDAWVLHETATVDRGGAVPGQVLYDGLGLLDEKAAHLEWLNKHLPLRSVTVQDLDQWIRNKII